MSQKGCRGDRHLCQAQAQFVAQVGQRILSLEIHVHEPQIESVVVPGHAANAGIHNAGLKVERNRGSQVHSRKQLNTKSSVYQVGGQALQTFELVKPLEILDQNPLLRLDRLKTEQGSSKVRFFG